jgi:hypothetical protein
MFAKATPAPQGYHTILGGVKQLLVINKSQKGYIFHQKYRLMPESQIIRQYAHQPAFLTKLTEPAFMGLTSTDH